MRTEDLLRSLGLDGRLANHPVDVVRLAQLISELRGRVEALERGKRK